MPRGFGRYVGSCLIGLGRRVTSKPGGRASRRRSNTARPRSHGSARMAAMIPSPVRNCCSRSTTMQPPKHYSSRGTRACAAGSITASCRSRRQWRRRDGCWARWCATGRSLRPFSRGRTFVRMAMQPSTSARCANWTSECPAMAHCRRTKHSRRCCGTRTGGKSLSGAAWALETAAATYAATYAAAS